MATFNLDASIQKLHNNVVQIFAEKFPIEKNGVTFTVSDISFQSPEAGYQAQDDAFTNGTTLETAVRGTITATKDGKVVGSARNITLVRIPRVTERGTYIVNGNEQTFLNQMQLRPGIYVNESNPLSKGNILKAEIRSGKKRFSIVLEEAKSKLRIERLGMEYGSTGGSVDAISFLKVIGATEDEIQAAVGKETFKSLKQNNKPETLQAIYKKMHTSAFPGNEEATERIQSFLKEQVTFDDKAKKVSQQMIGQSKDYFDKSLFLSTLSQMFKELKKPGSTPSVDDIRFKEVLSSEDVVSRGVSKGVDEWAKRLQKSVNEQGEMNSALLKPLKVVTKEVGKVYQSDLAEPVDSPNPLDLFQKKNKLTMLGTGGLTTNSANDASRNLQDTAFAKIDPVETPQSVRMGLVQNLAQDAVIKDGKIYSKFYRVSNGKIDKSTVVDNIDPLDEYDEYIAFNIPSHISDNTITPPKVRVRHKGKFVEVDKNKVTLMDTKSTSHLSHATSLIPFGAHNDGARMLMGSSMQRQSLSLEDPDEPLVQSLYDGDSDKTMEEEVAEHASYLLRSPVSGKVTDIKDDFIEVQEDDGQKTKVNKLNYFSTGKMGGYINHKPVVKVGDTVESGGLLADGWQSKNGKLALGKNTIIAYMPFKGYNFEDGVVVSESFAKKMASEEIKTLEIEVNGETNIVADKKVSDILGKLGVSSGILSKLDEDGVIKKGEQVSNGDIFVAAYRNRDKEEYSDTKNALRRVLQQKTIELPADLYSNTSKYVVGYQKGKVIDVKKIKNDNGGIRVIIKLLSFKPMEDGDKLSGRHGNKGTITKILPDEEMPHTEDGQAVELIFSPLAVPSRKNLGQLLEVNAGLVAQKKGMSAYKVNNFDDRARKTLMNQLDEVGVPEGKMTLINPDTGKPYENPVTVGPMYIMKLKHKVEGKLTNRSIGAVDEVTGMPKKVSGSIDGERHNPQGVGGMEFWSLTSAGAVENIHEMTTLKSDGAGDKNARFEIFNAIRRGERIPEPVTPQTLKTLSEQVKAAGMQITPLRDNKKVTMDEKFTSLMLQPLGKEFRKQIKEDESREVINSKTGDALSVNKDKKGLYSDTIFGKDGDEWGKISLVDSMPNPLYLSTNSGPKPYEAMLLSKGFKNSDLKNIVEKGQFVVFDPKETDLGKYQILDINDPKIKEKYGMELEIGMIDAECGAAALKRLLSEVDLKEELLKAESDLKSVKKLSDRSQVQNRVRVLASALDNDMKPEDYLMDFVPVLPTKFREPVRLQDGKGMTDDGITKLYQNFMKSNNRFKDAVEAVGNKEHLNKEAYSKFQSNAYQQLQYITGAGTTPYVDPNTGQEYKGILHTLGSKKGFLRDKMQSKRMDYSGRSVIIVDPTLNLDEVALPEDMAAEMFKPNIQKELMKQDYSLQEINKIMKDRTAPFRSALEKAIDNQPVILNRQPSLHRHSLQAFYPKIAWNDGKNSRAIGLNPMVTTAFNADFDGDTMAVHVPITEAAKQEARQKLMPSQNLYNPTNGSLIVELKHEMQLGIYYMTKDRMPTGTPKIFKNEKELRKAYDKGEVETYDAVQMEVMGKGMVTSTAGKHLFNSCLPPAFRNYDNEGLNSEVNKKKMTAIINNIVNDKRYGPMKAVESMNKLQKLGFQSATISGVSIGVKDFKSVANIDKKKLFDDAEKGINAGQFIDNRDEYEREKTKYVQDSIVDAIEKEGIIDTDNPVSIMMNSGARGNAGQITSMAGIIGAGKDVSNRETRAVTKSLLEGVSPDEFWDMSYDSRKGIYDRSVATRDPGALTRKVWMANKQTIITEKDCGTTKGINLNLALETDRSSLRGRILQKPIQVHEKDENGKTVLRTIPADGQPLKNKDYEIIKLDKNLQGEMTVRSPLTCETKEGVCQKCYGAKAGTMQGELVPIGEPVGSLAAQAIGEPSQQAIMKTFHTGAGGSSIGGAFKRIEQVFTMSKNNATNETILAQKAGTVTEITPDAVKGLTVKIDSKSYLLGSRELAEGLRVGSSVEVGEPLNKEMINGQPVTFRNPRTVFDLQGPEAAKTYLLSSVNQAFDLGDIGDTDKRHVEIAVSNMLNKATVDDPGTSKMKAGQMVPLKTIQMYNASAGKTVSASLDYMNRENVIGATVATNVTDRHNPMKLILKKGDTITEDSWEKMKTQRSHVKIIAKPVSYTQELKGVGSDTQVSNQNWLENAAYQDAVRTMGKGSAMFMKDQLDNPLTRQLAGQKGNFSEGFAKWKSNLSERFGDFF